MRVFREGASAGEPPLFQGVAGAPPSRRKEALHVALLTRGHMDHWQGDVAHCHPMERVSVVQVSQSKLRSGQQYHAIKTAAKRCR